MSANTIILILGLAVCLFAWYNDMRQTHQDFSVREAKMKKMG